MSVDALALPAGSFRAYLFDLDGTVADSMPLHYSAWVTALAVFGATLPEDQFYAWGGVPPRQVVERMNEKFGYTLDPIAVVDAKEADYVRSIPNVQPIRSVLAHIQAQRGVIAMAIVSGSPRESVEKTLAALGLTEYFPVTVCAEDYAHGKPHPEPFLKAAALLGVPPAACLVFEDADAGIASAEAAGMQWVRVPTAVPAA